MGEAVLLVCTVGGSPEAVAAAVKGCRPERIIFIASRETRPSIDTAILPALRNEGIVYSPGQYDLAIVPDAQDLTGCVETTRRLGLEVERWAARGEAFRVVADVTGGTKCMAASLALVARRWPCRFSYVGGTERNKDNVGVVISGKEQVLHFGNPWDSLGYQALEEAVVLFDRGDYRAAVFVLDDGSRRVQRADLERQLRTVKHLSDAYLCWDLFKHGEASEKLGYAQQGFDSLRQVLPGRSDALLSVIGTHRAFLSQLQSKVAGRHTVLDLLANARRCARRGRYDDAVARLYRAVEAAAQLRLHESHAMYQLGADGKPVFSKLAMAKIPQGLRTEWEGRARDGFLSLALQDDYRLLAALSDPLAERFRPLEGKESSLNARNQSILAHGFAPVGQKVCDSLWSDVLRLSGISEQDLPEFPTLGSSPQEKEQSGRK